MRDLENNPKVYATIKFINAGLQLFGNNFALYP